MPTAGAGYWLLVLPRPQFWLPPMVIGTVIRRQADPSRPRPACNRSRLGQLGLSTCPDSRCRVAGGGRFQAGGTVSMAGFRRPMVHRGEEDSGTATATLCYHYSNCYMASVCFRQPIRQAFSCCHRGMATVFATLLAISIHRIERLYVSHFEDWRRVAPVDTFDGR